MPKTKTFIYDPDSLASMMRCCFEYLEWRHGNIDDASVTHMTPAEVHTTVTTLRQRVLAAYQSQRKTPPVSVTDIARIVVERVLDGNLNQVLNWKYARLLKLARKVDVNETR